MDSSNASGTSTTAQQTSATSSGATSLTSQQQQTYSSPYGGLQRSSMGMGMGMGRGYGMYGSGGLGGLGGGMMMGGMGGGLGMNPMGQPPGRHGGFRQDYHTFFAGLKNLLQILYSGLGLFSFGKIFFSMSFNLIKTICRKCLSGAKYTYALIFLNRHSAKVINGILSNPPKPDGSRSSDFFGLLAKVLMALALMTVAFVYYMMRDASMEEEEQMLKTQAQRRRIEEEAARIQQQQMSSIFEIVRRNQNDPLQTMDSMETHFETALQEDDANQAKVAAVSDEAKPSEEGDSHQTPDHKEDDDSKDHEDSKEEDHENDPHADHSESPNQTRQEIHLDGQGLSSLKTVRRKKKRSKAAKPVVGDSKAEEKRERRKFNKISEEFKASTFRRELQATENGDTMRRLFAGDFTAVYYPDHKYSEEEKLKRLQSISRLASAPTPNPIISSTETPVGPGTEGSATDSHPPLARVMLLPEPDPTAPTLSQTTSTQLAARKKPWER